MLDGKGFINHLQAKMIDIKPGWIEMSIPISEIHMQQDGFVHAGVLASLADHCSGLAAYTLIAPEEIVLTIEFKINLLRPAVGNQIFCVGQVLRAGKTVTVAESEVFAEKAGEKKLVAKGIVTLATLTP